MVLERSPNSTVKSQKGYQVHTTIEKAVRFLDGKLFDGKLYLALANWVVTNWVVDD